MSDVAIVIPARFGSTRLPGKPLLDIAGKPMIQHIFERAKQVNNADEVVVATDDERVAAAVRGFGGCALITSPDHDSGTDRLVEVAQSLKADIYLNIQGDEPLVRPADLEALLTLMRENSELQVGTLCHVASPDEVNNPSCVKVVKDDFDYALYFSRSPIPYPRAEEMARYFKHVGVYCYRREVLMSYSLLQRPMLESAECLEQLRFLSAGIRIKLLEVEPTGPGVDTLDDLELVRAIVSGKITLPLQHQSRLADMRLVITDVDGVLTDGGIYYDSTGECQKRFHVQDGLGIRMLEECGIKVAILSGRDSPTLRKRIDDLGISLFQLGVKDKALACTQLIEQADVTAIETGYVGDDSIDLPAFSVCGLSFAVANAPEYIQRQASYILNKKGGDGAFREVADLILTAQGKEHVFNSAEDFISTMNKVAQ
jgi:3-deoxy-D-manno-octulosonate 8-phosphate phosphatase (KDO 8-P phosphatase)